MKLLWSVLIVLTIGLQYRLWVGEGSFSEVWHMQDVVESQLKENQRLDARNRRLDAEVLDLKKGYQAIEERARRELGMIGPDETFYLVVSSHQ